MRGTHCAVDFVQWQLSGLPLVDQAQYVHEGWGSQMETRPGRLGEGRAIAWAQVGAGEEFIPPAPLL